MNERHDREDANADNTPGPDEHSGSPGDPQVPESTDTTEFEPVPADFHPEYRPQPAYSSPYGRERTAAFPAAAGASTGELPPDGPPPASGPAEPRPTRPKRRVGLIVTLSAAALVLILVIAAVGGELYLRNKTKDCLQQSFGQVTGAPTSVSLSKTPMLWQWATGTMPSIQIDTKDSGSAADGSVMRLHAKATDLKQDGNSATVKSVQGTGYLPFSRIVDLSKQEQSSQQDNSQSSQSGQTDQGGLLGGGATSGGGGGGLQISKLTGNAGTGTVTVDASAPMFIFSVPVSTELKPTVTDGKLSFQVVKASAIGLGVPPQFAQVVINGLSSSMFPPLFDKLHFDSLKVTDNGVDFSVSGQDVPLNQQTLGSTQSSSSSNSGCVAA